MYRILAVEDDPDAISVLKLILGKNGFEYDVAENGDAAISLATTYPYDVITLDIMLPDVSGFEILTTLRQRGINTPVIITSALDTEDNVICGFSNLADDYVTKPFDPEELVARIHTQLRRPLNTSNNILEINKELKYCIEEMQFMYKDDLIEITKIETRLLYYLLKNRKKAVPKNELMDYLYHGSDEPEKAVLDTTLSNLRKKLAKLPINRELVGTIRRKGLMFQL